MTDMFTILLVFLLQTYVSNDETIQMDALVKPPASASESSVTDGTLISISNSELKLDQKLIASLNDGHFNRTDFASSQNGSLTNLESALKEKLKIIQENQTHKKSNSENAKNILINADRSISYSTIKKVIFTATQAGFSTIKFVTVAANE